MDPAVATRLADSRQRTNYLVEIGTTPPLLWTPYPGGLTYSAKSYIYWPFSVSSITETNDGVAKRVLTLTIPNLDGAATPLVSNLANRRKSVTVTKLHFDDAWAIVGSEWVFAGVISKPRIVGENVQLVCVSSWGRTGPSPRTKMKDVLSAHLPPDTITF